MGWPGKTALSEQLLENFAFFRDIFLLWLRYAVGAWRLPEKMD